MSDLFLPSYLPCLDAISIYLSIYSACACTREDGSFNIEYDDGDKEFKVPVTRIRLEVAIVAKQIYFAVSVSTIISASTIISYYIIIIT